MDVETIKVLAVIVAVVLWLLIVKYAVEMLVHLIKGPRCPDCYDWLETVEGRVGVAYKCPGCRGLFSNQEVEAHRERQSTRNG